MSLSIEMTVERFVKNPNTKTTYILESIDTIEIEEQKYYNYFGSVSFFRNLGGSETVVKGYTCAGYVKTKLTSISPDRQIKIIRSFKFTSNL